MGQKYYAVVKGRKPGIYSSWEECKAQVEQFSGAVHKSFPTLAEAVEFIENAGVKIDKTDMEQMTLDLAKPKEQEEAVSTDRCLIAYVDGSYDHSQLKYAYGCALVLPEEVVRLNGSDAEPDYVEMRNVAGEILGSEQAVLWALEHGYQEIVIYYDYEGIEKWANGVWKANKPGTQRYKEFIAKMRKQITISFQKVAAHTGVKYNEMADQLAKEALGL